MTDTTREPRVPLKEDKSAKPKTAEYRVKVTTIFDINGTRVDPGGMAVLDKDLAEKFHKLGYLDLDLDFDKD